MSQSSLQAMRLLLKMAQHDLDLAAERLAKAHRTTNEAKQQKEQLLFYKQEYVLQNAVRMSQGMTVVDLQNFQSFLKNIDTAIQSQDRAIEQYHAISHQQMLHWQASQAKKRKYEILIEKNEKQARLLALKQDQKLMDEFSTTQFLLAPQPFH
ncbi:flagellar export protein FliJ [Polynucleobacter paludilacus]|uniref:flagellar export protein FliJ n=1 Tax=Polynucleobacter paludilacus TaxID=1855895 RepID=UPI001BFE925C|nr:flagellar export protein FliJ [Polynucleobacter paludilacus]QWD87719.1 flagellar export protein FliJ [Polynucleobacter paludilacus]